MRITIVGAGAVGGVLGARLAAAGEDVTFVARPGEHADRILKEGLRLHQEGSVTTVHADVAYRIPREPGLLVLAVKMQDLPPLLPELRETDAQAVVALQNGVLADAWMVDAVGADRAYGAVVSFDSEYLRPGEVELLRMSGLTVGRAKRVPGTGERRLLELAHRLAKAGPVHLTENLRGARWTKLLVNLNNALPAATGLSMQEAYRSPLVAWLGARALREGVRVARKERVLLEPIPWADPRLMRLAGRLPGPVAGQVLARRVEAVLGPRAAFGSTYQSIARGRRTEIDYLNGEIVRLGRRRNVPTPVNSALVAAVKRAERGEGFLDVHTLLRQAVRHA